MAPFDIVSDVGGSIRIPAHFCDVFGLKPTENRVSHEGHIPGPPGAPRSVRLLASIGPMACSVEDLSLLFGLIDGPDGRDVEVPPVPLEPEPPLPLGRLRIAFAPTFPGLPAAASVADAVEELAGEVEAPCAAVKEAPLPGVDGHGVSALRDGIAAGGRRKERGLLVGKRPLQIVQLQRPSRRRPALQLR